MKTRMMSVTLALLAAALLSGCAVPASAAPKAGTGSAPALSSRWMPPPPPGGRRGYRPPPPPPPPHRHYRRDPYGHYGRDYYRHDRRDRREAAAIIGGALLLDSLINH